MAFFKLGKMTFSSLFKKPETLLYPKETTKPPLGLKGHVVNNVSACILCGICQKRCPAGAIEIDKAQRTWSIDRFRCVQCESCVRECPKKCLEMDPAYAPCATSKSADVFCVPEKEKKAAVEKKAPAKDNTQASE